MTSEKSILAVGMSHKNQPAAFVGPVPAGAKNLQLLKLKVEPRQDHLRLNINHRTRSIHRTRSLQLPAGPSPTEGFSVSNGDRCGSQAQRARIQREDYQRAEPLQATRL